MAVKRSMHPEDFDASSYVNEIAKPLKASSAIALGYVGIHLKFDILGAEIFLGRASELETALGALEKLRCPHSDVYGKKGTRCTISCMLKAEKARSIKP
jgi:hypothetical protein